MHKQPEQFIMLKSIFIFFIISFSTLSLYAQSDTLSYTVKLLHPHNLAKWNIPAGNYSGITPLGNNRYAVVTDKPTNNGFYEFEIILSPKGKIISVSNLGFHSDSTKTATRDMEGIIYRPSTNTVFISAESDQQILEYYLNGQQTGNKLNIPNEFNLNNIQLNYGFEALAYSPETKLFWTTTENYILSDKPLISSYVTLRLQSFTDNLCPASQYYYHTDSPTKHNKKHRHYAFGVPAITALPDGTLLVLERELYVSKNYLTSSITTKIYRIIPSEDSYNKTLITKFRTRFNKLSNYEGMCLGPKLPDGTQTLLLICDSQNRYGNSLYHLKDKIRVILLSTKR